VGFFYITLMAFAGAENWRMIWAGAEYTQQLAYKLHDSELFSRPEFIDVHFCTFAGYGRDGRNGNARRTSNCVYSTSRPPASGVNTEASGL
jgi:hypothetical protein